MFVAERSTAATPTRSVAGLRDVGTVAFGAGRPTLIHSSPKREYAEHPLHFVSGIRAMTDHVYKIVELVGSSPTSMEDAIQSAIARASSTVDNIRWFEVLETRGHVEGGKVSHYQVTIKVGFTVKE
ncbi:hypothetical protein GCM10023325_13670 [Sphingomonas lutea]